MTLSSDRSLTFHGPIRTPATTNLRTALCTLVNEGASKVTILFSSDGGSTDDGIALYTFLKALPMRITMHAVGMVGSIAIPIFLSGNDRIASANSAFFFHEYSWTHAQGTTVTQTTMTEQTLLLGHAMRWTEDIVKASTKLTDQDFKSMHLFDHPVLLSPADAANYGIVSKVAEPTIVAGNDPRIVV